MEAYYHRQAALPHFSSYSRQRGSGNGALVAGIGRVAIPFARKVLWPAAKAIGRELLMDAIPEIGQVITKRKSPKQAARDTLKQSVRRQLGKGVKRRVKRGKVAKRRVIRNKKFPKRSRLNFFTNVKNAV